MSPQPATLLSKHQRLDEANAVIRAMAGVGRRFFYNERHDRVARFELTLDGRLWFRDDYADKRIYVAYRGRWREFSHGGTMRRLVDALAEYIRSGKRIAAGHFGPWPAWVSDGDLWGYGDEAMASLRAALAENDCIARKPEAPVAEAA